MSAAASRREEIEELAKSLAPLQVYFAVGTSQTTLAIFASSCQNNINYTPHCMLFTCYLYITPQTFHDMLKARNTSIYNNIIILFMYVHRINRFRENGVMFHGTFPVHARWMRNTQINHSVPRPRTTITIVNPRARSQPTAKNLSTERGLNAILIFPAVVLQPLTSCDGVLLLTEVPSSTDQGASGTNPICAPFRTPTSYGRAVS